MAVELDGELSHPIHWKNPIDALSQDFLLAMLAKA